MKIFFIYQKNTPENDIKIIESGHSIFAGIFNIFWAIYHSMWFVAIPAVIVTFMVKYFLTGYYAEILEFFWIIFFYVLSEELQIFNLVQKGFVLKDIICASNKEEAEYKYIERNYENETI